MFETLTNEEERGQVGIGTLIVFIAMVLVAAIAAGVLINTAGFLQTQAEATGEESTAQVTNNVDIVSSVGIDTETSPSDDTTIEQINLVLKKSPGSDPIDLTQTEIQYVGPGTVTTTQLSDGDVNLVGISGGSDILESQSDRVEVQITLAGSNDFSATSALTAGDEVEITLTTASGAQTFETLRVSDPLSTPEDL
ncbi:MAG: archaeal flagellin N-terminal-like domain protein [uncultured archaeon A07HR67]|nr:MAG: archaeal flagellin N-terminal-like domain protein [uncultured archaeon A07HR67]